jgi:plasmid stabilization system protein ParE
MANVILTGPARRDIQANYDWWKENRSAEQADRWYQRILAAVKSLRRSPERCVLAAEADLHDQGIL